MNDIFKQLRLIPAQEILDHAHTPDWLVDGLIHEGSCILLNGAPKSGKSLLALRLAGCVSTGSPLAGRQSKQGRVCYMALERPDALRARMQAIIDAGLPFDARQISAYTHVVDFLDGERVESFVDHFDGAYPSLMIVDTLRRAYTGDENNNNLMTKWCQGVEHLRDLTGSAVVVVHHNRRDQVTPHGRKVKGDYAGAGALLGSFDAQLACIREANGVVRFKIEGANEGNDFDAHFEVEQVTVFGTHSSAILRETTQSSKPDLDLLVIAVLKRNPRVTQTRLRELCVEDETIREVWPDLNKGTIRKIVRTHQRHIRTEGHPDDKRKKMLTYIEEDKSLSPSDSTPELMVSKVVAL